MSKAIEDADMFGRLRVSMVETASENTGSDAFSSTHGKLTPDEALVRGYLKHSLHLRRTLDQFYYSMLDTTERDGDQVVYRHGKRKRFFDSEVKILMVDQLWLWVIGGR